MPLGGLLPYPEDEEEEAAPEQGVDILREMISLASAYAEVEQDDEDLLAIEKVRTLIQQLLARNQKESDQLLSGQMNPRALRKAVGG